MEEGIHECVIVGAGISGLATALALHRKGIKSTVLERSESLRVSGSAIGIRQNGWRALDQLGVGDTLRQLSLPIPREREIMLKENKLRERPLLGETRCLKRMDIINVLSDALPPPNTILFGCRVVSVALDPQTSYPILHLVDGTSIRAKVVIGCDGANSIVAEFLELKPTKVFTIRAVRGLTSYPNGHPFPTEFLRVRRGKVLFGRLPVDNNLVYWFASHYSSQTDPKIWQDPEVIRDSALESLDDFPREIKEVIKSSDIDSLSITHVRYRAPWDLLMTRFYEGTVTVAGDAMHVMGPFLGQGGSVGLEDAIVLARSLAEKSVLKYSADGERSVKVLSGVEEALGDYVKQRRMRVVALSTQTYLTGKLLEASSFLMRFIYIFFMVILFRDQTGHTKYDCGTL